MRRLDDLRPLRGPEHSKALDDALELVGLQCGVALLPQRAPGKRERKKSTFARATSHFLLLPVSPSFMARSEDTQRREGEEKTELEAGIAARKGAGKMCSLSLL